MMSGADYLRLALTCGSNSNKAIQLIRSGRAATLPVQPKRHVHCGTPHEQRLAAFDYLARLMPREFKPVRFFVLMGVAGFVVCGVEGVFYHCRAHCYPLRLYFLCRSTPSLHSHGYYAPRSRRVVTVTPENRDEVFPAI